jgi:isopentenyl diphosphate isomerase/L-lactate dehydrogenase-like FMN-dependent dehydrogenase
VAAGLTDLPIFLRGVLRADDARHALDAGVDGLIVSNHGGRQVDGPVAALEALAAVRAVVRPRIPVLLGVLFVLTYTRPGPVRLDLHPARRPA